MVSLRRFVTRFAIEIAISAALLRAVPAAGQDAQPPEGDSSWNSPEVLALVAHARASRSDLAQDGDLRSYRALTQGHVYFFVDPEVGERALIRVDQIAVELRWQAPDLVQQHIVGERSETQLPVPAFRYYLDRLTLVQYGLGDEIQVGSGMDVDGVPHPFAPLSGGAGAVPYEYRLADSLSLSLPGRPEPLRLYDIDVRPVDSEAPGILGSVTVDQASAEIVRMAFTFTPASYVDPRTDRISVELDYGLWEDRYWLPNVQRIEVRREMPELDIGVGTVIRAVLRTGDYELNAALPDGFRTLPPVTADAEAVRREYPFPTALFDGLAEDGLADVVVDADPRELRAKAMELARGRPPSGLSPLRLHLSGISSLLRFSRAEGTVFGAGAVFRPGPRLTLTGDVGYRAAAQELHGTLVVEAPVRPNLTLEMKVARKGLRDLGLAPGSDPLLSSLGALFRGEDYRDPFYTSGAEARVVLARRNGSRLSLGLGWDRIASAELQVTEAPLAPSRTFRPLREVAEGDFLRAEVDMRSGMAWPLEGRGGVQIGMGLLLGEAGRGGHATLGLDSRWGPQSGEREIALRASAWGWIGDPLPQGHRLLGGRGTLPGYRFREFVGRRAAVATLEASADAGTPLLRLRGGLHAGWSGGAAPEVAEPWGARETGQVRSSVSLGAGFFWDILRLEAARGLNGGEWQLILSVDPRWWNHL